MKNGRADVTKTLKKTEVASCEDSKLFPSANAE